MKCQFVFAALVAAVIGSPAFGQSVISTQFNLPEGFIQGDTDPATLTSGDFSVEFSGGQQQQFFFGPAYNVGPAAYVFINGAGGFFGAASTGDTGAVSFGQGASEVSFFAGNLANGPATSLTVRGTDGTVLDTIAVTQNNIQAATNPEQTVLNALDLGGLIGSIEVNLPGPASPTPNPPYAAAIDTFVATRASVFDDSVNGPASSIASAPTLVDFEIGSNTIAGEVSANSVVDNVRNYYTFTIEEGEELEAITILDTTVDITDAGTDPVPNPVDPGFFALFGPGDTPADPSPSTDPGIGGALFGPDATPFGTNLLDLIADGGISSGDGFSSIGPGTYTFLIQQTGPEASSFLLDFQVAAIPEPTSAVLLSLAGCFGLARRRR